MNPSRGVGISVRAASIRTAGPHALLLQCGSGARAAAVAAALLARRVEIGARDVVAGADTVLVQGASLHRDAIEAVIDGAGGAADTAAETATFSVSFDGPDLPERRVLRDELVDAVCCADWTVGFLGFAPGFGYLLRDDVVPGSPLFLPRRTEPRSRVPAGSVALAAGYAAIYPHSSPGGWNLVGTIDSPEELFDIDTGARLRPGMRVRFHV